MSFEDVAIRAGDYAFTWLEVALAGAGVAFVLLLASAILAWRAGRTRMAETLEARRHAGELEFRLADMAGQLRQFAEQNREREAHMAQSLNDRLDQVSFRVGQGLNQSAERTSQSLQTLHERLAVIDAAQARLASLSSEMLTLKDILSNKQARGAYGQARMEAIISDGLHRSAYTFQGTLSNRTRPDCLISLPDSELRVVIDAKFPLEAFNALKQAAGEADIKQAEQRLRGDIAKHVKDIAERYLIRGETHETAIMFVPAESIYAELYERFEDVIQKAHRQRVIVASPNVLMLLVQTMQAVFRDARMREQAGLIQQEVARMMDDVERMRTRVLDLQRHFGQAGQDIDKILVSSDKIARRGQKIEQLELKDETGEAADRAVQAAKPKLVAGE